jgi:hypothetical protein
MLLLLDTGLRIEEALGLKWSDVNWDDLLVKVLGKGSKKRIVPISLENAETPCSSSARSTHHGSWCLRLAVVDRTDNPAARPAS